jgi:DNA repair protein RadC
MWIKEIKHNERPREKARSKGITSLTDSELMALLLRTGSSKDSAIEVAQRLTAQHTLSKLSRMTIHDYLRMTGIGMAKATSLVAAFELGRRIKHDIRPQITTPNDVYSIVYPMIAESDQEQFVGVFLDTQHQLIEVMVLFKGTLNASVVHPREILKPAIGVSAASIIVAHNHPSGDVTPSPADIEMTKQLHEAAKVMHIPLLDHVIVSRSGFLSMHEIGIL